MNNAFYNELVRSLEKENSNVFEEYGQKRGLWILSKKGHAYFVTASILSLSPIKNEKYVLGKNGRYYRVLRTFVVIKDDVKGDDYEIEIGKDDEVNPKELSDYINMLKRHQKNYENLDLKDPAKYLY